MRGQHLGRALGSDHRAITDSTTDAEASTSGGDIGSTWAIAFVVFVLLALLPAFV
jgi:hypothetical protein